MASEYYYQSRVPFSMPAKREMTVGPNSSDDDGLAWLVRAERLMNGIKLVWTFLILAFAFKRHADIPGDLDRCLIVRLNQTD